MGSKKGSNLRIFHNRCIFYLVIFDVIQRHPFHPFVASAKHKGSNSNMAAIRSGLTRSATFSTSNVSLLSVLSSTCFQDQRCIDIILIAPKYILQIEHTRFFKSTLTTWLHASCGIPRGYFLRTHVGIRPLMGIVWCNDSYWLVLSDLVHINPLSRLKRHRIWRWQKHFLYNIFAWWPKRPINNM